MADGSATWIAKPSITNQAIGICIFDRVSTLRSALEAAEDMREWVVQRYVTAPKGFHIPFPTSLILHSELKSSPAGLLLTWQNVLAA